MGRFLFIWCKDIIVTHCHYFLCLCFYEDGWPTRILQFSVYIRYMKFTIMMLWRWWAWPLSQTEHVQGRTGHRPWLHCFAINRLESMYIMSLLWLLVVPYADNITRPNNITRPINKCLHGVNVFSQCSCLYSILLNGPPIQSCLLWSVNLFGVTAMSRSDCNKDNLSPVSAVVSFTIGFSVCSRYFRGTFKTPFWSLKHCPDTV